MTLRDAARATGAAFRALAAAVDCCGGLDPLLRTTLAIATAERLPEVCQIATAPTCPDRAIPRVAGNSRVEALYLYVVETATWSKLPDRYKNPH